MAEEDSWDAESFEPGEATAKPVVLDKWEGEDDDEDVKDNWDDEEELKEEDKKTETKQSEKKKQSEKTKEKQTLQIEKQEQLREGLEESQESAENTPEEESAEKPTGVTNNVTGIDAISPSSRDDFTEFERLLKDKISPYEKSIHYSGFLESLFRDLCLSLEVEDLKKINTSVTVLLSEKQKQEKQQNKGKKKKKGAVTGGGLKAKMKDDLADYGEFDGGYAQDYEDFM